MDVLRAVSRTNGTCLSAFHAQVTSKLTALPAELRDSGSNVKSAAQELLVYVAENVDTLEVAARDLAFSIARIYMGEWLWGLF